MLIVHTFSKTCRILHWKRYLRMKKVKWKAKHTPWILHCLWLLALLHYGKTTIKSRISHADTQEYSWSDKSGNTTCAPLRSQLLESDHQMTIAREIASTFTSLCCFMSFILYMTKTHHFRDGVTRWRFILIWNSANAIRK